MAPRLPRPAAILVDLDDTIITAGLAAAAWAEVLVAFDGRFGGHGREAVHRAVTRAAEHYWADPERHRVGRHDIRAARREIVRQALEPLGCAEAVLCAEVAEAFSDHRERATACFPGAVAALEALRARGMPLGLVTNGAAAVQRAKIERFDLARHFDHVLVEGEFGRGKPDPEVFRHLMDCFGTTPERTWVVGDNLEWEVVAPQRLGMRAVWCDAHRQGLPEGCGIVPDRIIYGLPELLDDLDG